MESLQIEEDIIVENPPKKPEEFVGTYTKNGLKDTTRREVKRNDEFVARQYDYNSINKTKNTRGTFGEVLIYNDEVARLLELGIEKQVDHVAKTKGDGLGYDILSFDDEGNELFIEVKTTTANRVDGFYLTPKELAFAEKNTDRYRLFRVYNLDMDKGTYSVEIFTGEEVLNIFELKPTSFIALKK